MQKRQVETALGANIDRSVSPLFVADLERAYEKSGVVDHVLIWDQLRSWWPRSIWTPDVTTIAELITDCDSFPDPFVLSGIAAAATDSFGVCVTTDALRRGPSE